VSSSLNFIPSASKMNRGGGREGGGGRKVPGAGGGLNNTDMRIPLMVVGLGDGV
jgi:hypothetical protein